MKEITHYTKVAKCLHWMMAVIWISAWVMGILAAYFRETFNAGSQMTGLHKATASMLILLIVMRIAWRLSHKPPALPQDMSLFMKKMAHYGHLLLYGVVLIAMPLSGWLLSSAAGRPIMVAGIFELPPLISQQARPTSLLFREIHTYLGWFCALLVVGHILFALKHHFIDKDTILLGMLPKKSRNKHTLPPKILKK